ncbi:hypothetical protein P4O66_004313 [Electrophorus voltai]|uniref:G-patch domain-containing protein n=1 Tax=Electrophorus voltai TaxID=2609070 RepID=A0AAD8ZNN0_9TELE|nr:hypothetical protein P4O66_004313 [Electrophorus voltai]
MSSVGLFVRATQEDRRWTEGDRTEGERRRAALLSGEEVSDYYRCLLTEEGGDGCRIRIDENRATQPRPGGRGRRPHRREAGNAGIRPGGSVSVVQEREGHCLLRCAQDGDVRVLRQLLSQGCNVNFHDAFYWTPVMCASHAGQREVLRLLLQAGAAWVGVVDTQVAHTPSRQAMPLTAELHPFQLNHTPPPLGLVQSFPSLKGRDARDLAMLAGHQDVVHELEEFSITENSDTPLEDAPSASAQWCAVCQVTYTDSTRTHSSSTLHQFSVKRPLMAPHYCLPPSSTSYKMMLRSGWDPASGLGPAHTGRRHPVGTVLKQNQAGLGYGPPLQARVTHFQAKDPQAVRRAPKERQDRKERGRTLRRREQRDRDWEMSYRTSFHLDA